MAWFEANELEREVPPILRAEISLQSLDRALHQAIDVHERGVSPDEFRELVTWFLLSVRAPIAPLERLSRRNGPQCDRVHGDRTRVRHRVPGLPERPSPLGAGLVPDDGIPLLQRLRMDQDREASATTTRSARSTMTSRERRSWRTWLRTSRHFS